MADVWKGSATCTIKTINQDYSDEQTHTWSLFPGLITTMGPFTYYASTWTVTGGGSNSTSKWTYNGIGFGSIRFWKQTPIISPGNSQLRDNTGTYVTPKSGASFTVNVFEQALWVPITAQTPTDATGMSSPMIPSTATIGYQDPGGNNNMHTATCSWDFHFGPVQLIPLPLKPKPRPFS